MCAKMGALVPPLTPLITLIILVVVPPTQSKVSLYLSSDQTEALYGNKTDGLYYVREGVVNKYAMNFQHQVSGMGYLLEGCFDSGWREIAQPLMESRVFSKVWSFPIIKLSCVCLNGWSNISMVLLGGSMQP